MRNDTVTVDEQEDDTAVFDQDETVDKVLDYIIKHAINNEDVRITLSVDFAVRDVVEFLNSQGYTEAADAISGLGE